MDEEKHIRPHIMLISNMEIKTLKQSINKPILGERLLISSLPGKALRTLVDIARLAEQFNKRSQSRTR